MLFNGLGIEEGKRRQIGLSAALTRRRRWKRRCAGREGSRGGATGDEKTRGEEDRLKDARRSSERRSRGRGRDRSCMAGGGAGPGRQGAQQDEKKMET